MFFNVSFLFVKTKLYCLDWGIKPLLCLPREPKNRSKFQIKRLFECDFETYPSQKVGKVCT